MMTKTGVVQFSAPEIFCQSEYDEKVDVWSAGIILYMMLSGTQPFLDPNMPRLVKKISTEEPNFDLPAFKQVNKQALDLLKNLLKKNPQDRPSAEECLLHPWITS